jgi:hypothetical protein
MGVSFGVFLESAEFLKSARLTAFFKQAMADKFIAVVEGQIKQSIGG